MDINYTIKEIYSIKKPLKISDGTLMFPLEEGQYADEILFSRAGDGFSLPVSIRTIDDVLYACVSLSDAKELDPLYNEASENGSLHGNYRIFLIKDKTGHPLRFDSVEPCKLFPVSSKTIDNKEYLVTAYPSGANSHLWLCVETKDNLYRKAIVTNLSKISGDDHGFTICVVSKNDFLKSIPDRDKFFIGMWKTISDKPEVRFPATFSVDEDKVYIKAKISYKDIPDIFSHHREIGVIINIAGFEYKLAITNPKKRRRIANSVLLYSKEHAYSEPDGQNKAYPYLRKSGFLMLYTGMKNSLEKKYPAPDSFESFTKATDEPFGIPISVTHISAANGKFIFRINDSDLNGIDEIAVFVYIKPGMGADILNAKITDADHGIIEADTTGLDATCDVTETFMLKMGLSIRKGDKFLKALIYQRDTHIDHLISRYGELDEFQNDDAESEDENASTVYLDNIYTKTIGDTKMDFSPYINSSGYYRIRVCRRENMTIYKIVSHATKVHVSSKWLKIQAICPDEDGRRWTGFSLNRHHKADEDADDRFFPADTIKKTPDGTILTANINIQNIEFTGIYWAIRTVFEDNGDKYFSAVKAIDNRFEKEYKKLFQRNSKYYYNGGEKYILFPYLATNGNINLMYRTSSDNDGFIFRLKERMGLRMFQLMKHRLLKKKSILIYEKYCYMAQDNAYQFFLYCMKNNMEKYLERKIYYVIDKHSPDYEKVKPYKKNVLNFMSVRFIAVLLASKLLVSSDVRTHVYAWRHRSSIIDHVIAKKYHIFLQHGVTAMKQVHNIFGKKKGTPTNLFIVTSDEEYDIVSKYFGYSNNEIALTGFTRWDVLTDKSKGHRDILIMPTWRNWLDDASPSAFKESDYYKNYMNLLNSDRLKKLLDEKDVNMKFYIHPKFKDYMNQFIVDDNKSRISLIPFGEIPLNELMMECNLLITDYSSVSWDVYYMKKPVIFYQFDLSTYEQAHGSYLDMRKDLFGKRTENLDELITLIEEAIDDGFRLNEPYLSDHKKHFKYMDKNNCKRVCNVIREKKL